VPLLGREASTLALVSCHNFVVVDTNARLMAVYNAATGIQKAPRAKQEKADEKI